LGKASIFIPEVLRDPRAKRILTEIHLQGKVRPKDLTSKLKELGMSRQTLFNRLGELTEEGFLIRRYDTSVKPTASTYELSEKAERLLLAASEAVTVNDIIGSWPMILQVHFSYPIEVPEAEKPYEEYSYEEYALGVSVHYKGRVDDLMALYRKRLQEAGSMLIRAILGIAKARGLLKPEYFTGKKGWDKIPMEKWKQIFSELFQGIEEIVYIEHLGVRDLLTWLQQPGVNKYLRKLSSRNSSVPDYKPFLERTKAEGELKPPRKFLRRGH
jgi:DNA-binding HxlR family transcriptional regulator